MKKLFALASILSLLIFSNPSPAHATVSDFVSCYDLNETSGTRADYNGVNTLTDNNTVTYGTGIINNAALFTPANSEFLGAPSGIYSLFNGTQPWTISVWVYWTKADYATVFSTNQSTSASGYYKAFILRIENDGTLLVWRGGTGTALDSISTTLKVSASTWTLVTVTYDGSTVTVYKNADTPQTGASTKSSVTQGLGDVGVWRESSASYYYYGGMLDQMSFFNRAISSAEVSTLYNGGSGESCATMAGGAVVPSTPNNDVIWF